MTEYKNPQQRVDRFMATRAERLGVALMLTIAVVVVGVGLSIAATVNTGGTETDKLTRACAMAAGSGWTDVNCSAGVAYSAALTKNTRYIVQAVSGSPYLAVTTAAAAQDADSNDGYLPEGAWLELFVPDATRYLSCDGSADTSRLRYVECQ